MEIEARIAELRSRRDVLEAALADPLVTQEPDRLRDLGREYSQIEPILVALDREILDAAQREDDDLPTMHHGQEEADRRRRAAPLSSPALTATPTDEASRPPPRSGTRRQLASDDVS